MEYYYLNTTRNRQPVTKNYSSTSTAEFVSSFDTEKAHQSRMRQAYTFLAFFIAGIVYLGLTGCHYLTKTSSKGSSEVGKAYSVERVETISDDSLKDYTLQADEQEEEALQPPPAPNPATGLIQLNKDRLVSLVGVINETTLLKANQLISLADKDDDPIDVVISSPGGSVVHGLVFVQAMKEAKAKGVTIRCHVPTLAASMAYVIFTQCDQRFALPYATLLFHSPRVSGTFVITAQNARQLANGLTGLENELLGMILPVMGVTRETGGMWFVEAYQGERLFLASDLLTESPKKWFTLVAEIRGYPGGEFPPPRQDDEALDRRSAKTPQVREAGR